MTDSRPRPGCFGWLRFALPGFGSIGHQVSCRVEPLRTPQPSQLALTSVQTSARRSTSGRSKESPLGNAKVASVAQGNLVCTETRALSRRDCAICFVCNLICQEQSCHQDFVSCEIVIDLAQTSVF